MSKRTVKAIKHAYALFLLTFCLIALNVSYGAVNVYEFDNALDEKRFHSLISELRCPTCQNQNLAESDSLSAKAMKDLTYSLIKDGRGDGEILDIMVDRYGDFVTYNPPFKPLTWGLWLTPVIILVLLVSYVLFFRRPKEKKNLLEPYLSPTEKAKLHALLEDKDA